VVRSPLRSGRRKTEVRWTSCAPSRAPYFMIVLLASLWWSCGGGGRRCLRTAGLCL